MVRKFFTEESETVRAIREEGLYWWDETAVHKGEAVESLQEEIETDHVNLYSLDTLPPFSVLKLPLFAKFLAAGTHRAT